MSLPDPVASRAVLIGVTSYAHLDPLPSVANNLVGVRQLLTGPESWNLAAPEHCVSLLDPTSSVEVLDAVSKAAEEATDALLVYFAGHGLVSGQGSLHLGLPNTHLERLWDSVDYDQLRPLVHECRARRSVVVLDCCYGGTAMRGHMGQELSLADLTSIEGTYLLTASAATRTAMAPEDEHYTAFTAELLRAAVEGVPDEPEILDMGTVFTHVRRELIAKGRPVPQQWARDLGQHIALVRNRWSPAPGPEAEAYASALRAAVERAGADAARLPGDTAVVGRWLRGERAAPKKFVDSLPAHGVVLAESDLSRLHSLRRAAQRTAPDLADQLLYWQEEVELLRQELGRAADYSLTVGTELAEEQEQIRRLKTEVKVLREQVECLMSEEPARAAVAVEVAVGAARTAEARATRAGSPEAVTAEGAPAPAPAPPSGCGLGALAAVFVLGVLYVAVVWLFSLGSVSLTYDSGRKPASAGRVTSVVNAPEGPRYVWDVADSVESTFRPDGDDATDRLLGDLTVTVPRGCESRHIGWQVSVDGRRIGHGSLSGGLEHEVKIDRALSGTAGKVALEAWWDGGSGSCKSFGVVWNDPRLSKSFDFLAW
ncbi:caspase family protein [Streptomyces sp. HGB0020]|uniref:caspase family protein n=1 Tax=Streptomyces sp. HGB0020 TaxID=1078086 RepID=UPI00034EA921|nr:caspase family protein [Streptomyces sp. HGB0020]EPD58865.1 hypothetical protein HMPREF1211_05804 [Streptomyces sp. HGB0020]